MGSRQLSSFVAAAALVLSACEGGGAPTTRSDAITHGAVDGNAHPAVGLLVMDVAGQPAFRCSGTFIAPKVFLTAGHCAGEPGEFSGMRVFTESDVQDGNNDFPFAGPNTIEAVEWHAHPLFTEAQFFLHDVGVVLLSSAFTLPASQYGTLPAANELEPLKPSAHTTFTAVGYGVQRINPAKVTAELIRMNAAPHLIQIDTGFTGTFSLLLSNNASTGGTCFGDSGGPNFLGTSNEIAGVTSFGLNGSCGGTGGVFRLDRQDVLDFVGQFLH
jgi:secreted trypsin-like serine protease